MDDLRLGDDVTVSSWKDEVSIEVEHDPYDEGGLFSVNLCAEEVRLLVAWMSAWLEEERAAPVETEPSDDDFAELPPSVWAATGDEVKP